MRKLSVLVPVLALVSLSSFASAHTGSVLDADGCHEDHRNETYHCHRGDAAGYTFPDQAAEQEAVRTGTFPEKTVETESFWSKLWPFGEDHGVGDPDSPPTGGTAAATAPAAAKPGDPEQRLKVLQGLYEMGLLSREEYESKRKAVVDGL